MCKPVLVTLPFVLLLLDYWPLNRLQFNPQCSKLKTLLPLVREKLPFFVLTVASSLLTILAHQALGMLNSASEIPRAVRLENALVSYGRYLGKAFWPCRLAVFYPYPVGWPTWLVVTCGLLLVILSLILATARTRPWMLVGWLWFLGVLVPFSGLVQAGAQAMADRFMYVPAIGIAMAVIWGWDEWAKRGRYSQLGLAGAGGAVVCLCLVLTRQQIGYWKDSGTLFRHALAVTKDNWLAHDNLGTMLAKEGRIEQAIGEYHEAIRARPEDSFARNNLGTALLRQGQVDGAIGQYQEAIRLQPGYADAHNNLGTALLQKGRIDGAISQYQEAIRLQRDSAEAHNNLGYALDKQGRAEEAIGEFQEALRLRPDNPDAHFQLGKALAKSGRIDQAISQLQEAVRLKPDDAAAHSNLGSTLAREGRMDEAIRQLREAIRLKPDEDDACYNLGNALARTGQIDEAIIQYRKAIALKPDDADPHSNLGVCLYRKGYNEEAIGQFRDALRLKPDHPDARKNLAIALAGKAPSGQPTPATGP